MRMTSTRWVAYVDRIWLNHPVVLWHLSTTHPNIGFSEAFTYYMFECCLVKSELSYMKNIWCPGVCLFQTAGRHCFQALITLPPWSTTGLAFSSWRSDLLIVWIYFQNHILSNQVLKRFFFPTGKRRNSGSSMGCSAGCWVLVIIQCRDLSKDSQKSHQLIWRCHNRRRSSRLLSGKWKDNVHIYS